jgi:thioesterase domain-containing protein
MSAPTLPGAHGVTSVRSELDRWCLVGAGDEAPLVAVHTWHGETEKYHAVAEALPGRRIYSVLPPKPDVDVLPRRVDDWVEHAIAVLDALPVDPPYRLVGWSFGGVIAVETARRLRERGTPVAFVGMIDTIRPNLRPLSTKEYVWYHLGEACGIPDERLRFRYLGVKTLQLLNRRFPVAGGLAKQVRDRIWPDAAPEEQRRTSRDEGQRDPLEVSIHVSYLNYRGRSVDFPVSLYATVPSCAEARGPALRWSGWLEAGFEFVMIPGDHHSLFEPEHVGAVAAALQHSLEMAETTATSVLVR